MGLQLVLQSAANLVELPTELIGRCPGVPTPQAVTQARKLDDQPWEGKASAVGHRVGAGQSGVCRVRQRKLQSSNRLVELRGRRWGFQPSEASRLERAVHSRLERAPVGDLGRPPTRDRRRASCDGHRRTEGDGEGQVVRAYILSVGRP